MRKVLAFIFGLATLVAFQSSSGWAITADPFGTFGKGGRVNGQSFSVGPGGKVEEIDAFLNIAGDDLNGGGVPGTSAQLSLDPLPSGLGFSFSPLLTDSGTDLFLHYAFTNNTGGNLTDVTFLSFLDAEIDEPINTNFNEFAMTSGTPGSGATDPGPDAFEVDEPGFVFGNIFDNLLDGVLDNTNALPTGSPDDVSMALAFRLGTIAAGETEGINILISEDGDAIGGFAIAQHDSDPLSTTTITYSGAVGAPVPEPGTFVLFGTFLLVGWLGYGWRSGRIRVSHIVLWRRSG